MKPKNIKLPNLRTKYLGHKLLYHTSIDSTQNEIKRQIAQGEGSNKGLSVFASHQSQGRGQHHRPWVSLPNEQFYLSFHWSFDAQFKRLGIVPIAVAVALVETLANDYGIHTQIKWPNDIFLKQKKCSGILCESVSQACAIDLYVGIGINLSARSKDIPKDLSSSLAALDSEVPAISAFDLLSNVFNNLEAALFQCEKDPSPLLQSFEKHDFLKNRKICVQTDASEIRGTAAGINALGQLKLKTENKEIAVSTGHILW